MRWLSPPRQGAAGAVEVEVIEPDIVQEAQALVDFLEDGAGDFLLLAGELGLERAEPFERVGDAAAGRQRDVLAGDLDRERLGAEAGAAAGLARVARLVARQLLAHPGALGLEHAAVEVADHALERLLDLVRLAAVDEAQGHRAALGAVEDDVAGLLGQVGPGRVEVEIVGAGEAGQHLHVIRRGRLRLGPGHDRALRDAEAVVGDDQSSSNTSFSPRPSQAGQAPWGALKLNSRGSISAMVKPETGQANFSREDDAAGRRVVELHAGLSRPCRWLRRGRRGRGRRGPRRA